MPKQSPVGLALLLFVGLFADYRFADASASISADRIKAGDTVTITGTIPWGEELHIAIASRKTFSPESAGGDMERSRLIKAGETFGFRKDTTIPYLYYIVTSEPEAYGRVQEKRFGGAFFFKGLYKTQMFKLKEWTYIPGRSRGLLGPVKTEDEWNLLRYAHEDTFGINTIAKERTCEGKVVIFSRCVVADEQDAPHYWNRGNHISRDKGTGQFTAEFKTFSHTSPDTEFDVYVNGYPVGSYVVEASGFWLPRAWRYVNPLLIVLAAVVAGAVSAMMGASGGMLMAAFQIMFVGTAGPLGVNSANVLKPSNLPLTFTTPFVGLYRYWIKEHRLALPAALAVTAGMLIGSLVIGPPLSSKYLNMSSYKPFLGVLVAFTAVCTLYELTPTGMRKRESVKGVVKKFNDEVRRAKEEGRAAKMGHVETVKLGPISYRFKFWGEEFEINIILFVVFGTLTGIVAVAVGIGGGFLLVPCMTILGRLPMYVAVPISLFSYILGSAAGMVGYMMMGYYPDPWLVLCIVVGGLIGGLIGSKLHGLFSEKQLKIMLAAILLFLVLRFLEIEIWI